METHDETTTRERARLFSGSAASARSRGMRSESEPAIGGCDGDRAPARVSAPQGRTRRLIGARDSLSDRPWIAAVVAVRARMLISIASVVLPAVESRTDADGSGRARFHLQLPRSRHLAVAVPRGTSGSARDRATNDGRGRSSRSAPSPAEPFHCSRAARPPTQSSSRSIFRAANSVVDTPSTGAHLYRSFAESDQRIELVRADSHRLETRDRVR